MTTVTKVRYVGTGRSKKREHYTRPSDGWLNAFLKEEITAHMEKIQKAGLLRPEGGLLFAREWIDGGPVNGASYYAVCWTLYPTSPCFKLPPKDDPQYKSKHAMLCKKFIVMLCPG